MTQFPPTHAPSMSMKPHRGGMLLAFGILGFVVCFIFSILAWVMGSADLKEMDAGRMDPSGRGLTQAAKILGMVWCILAIVILAFYIVIVVIVGTGAAVGAASSGG